MASVIFNTADGTEVSNDPAFRFKAFQEQQEEQRKALAALNGDDSSGVEEELPEDDNKDAFDLMGGKELKAYAEEHEIDLEGLRKVGEVREHLRAQAAAKAAEAGAASDEEE